MVEVWRESPYKLGSLLVHLCLADKANDDHNYEVWMHQEAIAKRCRLTVRQVRRVLATMEADGYLEVIEKGGGRGKPTLYRLVRKPGQIVPVSDGNQDIYDRKTGHLRHSPYITTEVNQARDDARNPMLGFDHFWTIYPKRNGRRIGKSLCVKRWPTLSLDDKRAAYRGAVNYAEDVANDKTIAKDPDRWLRDGLWEDWQEQVTTEEVNFDTQDYYL